MAGSVLTNRRREPGSFCAFQGLLFVETIKPFIPAPALLYHAPKKFSLCYNFLILGVKGK